MSDGEFYIAALDFDETETKCIKIVKLGGGLFAEHDGALIQLASYILVRRATKNEIDGWHWDRYNQYKRCWERASQEATEYSAKAESAYNEYIERMADE